jgi:hypothetical protein
MLGRQDVFDLWYFQLALDLLRPNLTVGQVASVLYSSLFMTDDCVKGEGEMGIKTGM